MTPEPMRSEHRGYVCATWARGQRLGMRIKPAFQLVNRIIDTTPVLVLASGPTVHAWACGEGAVLHYAYVPPELRGQGLVRELVTALLGDYPDRIRTTHPWPFASERYHFEPLPIAA